MLDINHFIKEAQNMYFIEKCLAYNWDSFGLQLLLSFIS